MAMQKLITSLLYVGIPKGAYRSYTAKVSDSYYVIWYFQDEVVHYNVSGPPFLIAATALIAKMFNERNSLSLEDISFELKSTETQLHHVIFVYESFIRGKNQSLS